jgi:hypothetical protein
LDLVRWLPIYERICIDFGYDPAKDLESANKLASFLGSRGLVALEDVRGRFPATVLVCGGAPRLADELSSMTVTEFVVAADGATTVLAESGVKVDAIVTDLDGIVEDQISMNAEGVPVFIHAHGDNQQALSRYLDLFPKDVIGTCQCAPPEGLVNYGGFTDGDRAACISAALGARTVMLAGFDFDRPSEKLGKSMDVKRRKLQWAKEILDELSREGVRILPALEKTD